MTVRDLILILARHDHDAPVYVGTIYDTSEVGHVGDEYDDRPSGVVIEAGQPAPETPPVTYAKPGCGVC